MTAEQLSLQHYGAPPQSGRHRVILPISNVHRGTLEALRYARALSHDVTAVHVSLDSAEAERLRAKWDLWGDGSTLTPVSVDNVNDRVSGSPGVTTKATFTHAAHVYADDGVYTVRVDYGDDEGNTASRDWSYLRREVTLPLTP